MTYDDHVSSDKEISELQSQLAAAKAENEQLGDLIDEVQQEMADLRKLPKGGE